MENNVSNNKGLDNLQAQVAKQEKMIQLCLQVISEFGHFVPSIIEAFKYEMKKLDAVDAVTNEGLNPLEGDDELPVMSSIDANLDEDEDGVTAS